MSSTRPFAYNTGGPISGTTDFGSTLISGDIEVDYSEDYGGVKWWMGPDEDLGYVIGNSRPGGQPVPSGVTGTGQVGFWRSKFKTNESFLDLANYIGSKNGQPSFANTTDAENWLNSQGYYSSYNIPTPTPSPTSTLTPTPTETNIPVTPTNTETPTPTPTPSVTTTQTYTPTETPTNTPTVTPTNPTLLQIINQTTGSRTITSCTLDGVNQVLSQGSYPITAGNNGFALTHGASVLPNSIQFNFGGSGAFDLYSYKNGSLVNYLTSYDNSSYVAGGITLTTSDQLVLIITDPDALVTPTPTITTTPSPTPSVTTTQTSTLTQTPTPSTSPIPITGYAFNLVALPYNFPTSGNSIMNNPGDNTSGSTQINLLTTAGRGFYFNSSDNDGIDRTSYFSAFTGQNLTITFSQLGNTAIYSGDTNSFKQWVQAPYGTGFVFGTGVGVPPTNTPSGTAILIQSASTNFVIGQSVYVSLA